MDFEDKTIKIAIRAAAFLGGLLAATTLIPALLSAPSDLAVLSGGIISIVGIGLGFTNLDKIIDWFKNIN
ncbi:MAG: hypothetical protein GY799_20955 [Desulfobulbaceae bacterium]|nr:hypothetical protein [Desulfobulbaceae bacterium]